MDEELQNLLIAAEQRFRSTWSSYLTRLFFSFLCSLFVCYIKLIFFGRDVFVLLLNGLHYLFLLPLDILIIIAYFAATFARNKANMSSVSTNSCGKFVRLKVVRRLFWSGSEISVGRRLRDLNVPPDILQIRKQGTNLARNWQNSLPKTKISFVAPSDVNVDPEDYGVSSRSSNVPDLRRSSSRPARSEPVNRVFATNRRQRLNTEISYNSKRRAVARILQEQMKKSLQTDDIEEAPRNSPEVSSTDLLPDSTSVLPVINSEVLKTIGGQLNNASRHHYGRRLYARSAAMINRKMSQSE